MCSKGDFKPKLFRVVYVEVHRYLIADAYGFYTAVIEDNGEWGAKVEVISHNNNNGLSYELFNNNEYIGFDLLEWSLTLDVENNFKDDFVNFVLDTIEKILRNGKVICEEHETV